MFTRFLAVVAAASSLAGCAAFPSIVTMPTGVQSRTAPYEPELAKVQQYAGVYPVEVDGQRLMDQAGLYAATWRKAATELLVQRDLANNAQFGATIAGVYDTARSSLRAAKWWLAGAAGIGLVEERYQIEAQALQYANAAAAMECVRTEVSAVPGSLWSEFDKDGKFIGASPPNIPSVPADAKRS